MLAGKSINDVICRVQESITYHSPYMWLNPFPLTSTRARQRPQRKEDLSLRSPFPPPKLTYRSILALFMLSLSSMAIVLSSAERVFS